MSPKIYLGGSVRTLQLNNGVKFWAFIFSHCVKAAVNNADEFLATKYDNYWKMPEKAYNTLQTSYHPDIYVSPELGPNEVVYYMYLIGIMRWMVETGWMYICLECSTMSSHADLLQEVHLNQVFHMFVYLQKYHNTEMVYEPIDPVIQ